jgi:epoxyqueuosine reductase QueG
MAWYDEEPIFCQQLGSEQMGWIGEVTVDNEPWQDIEDHFERLCTEAGRQGVIGFAPVRGVCLLPEQSQRLQQKLSAAPANAGPSTGRDAGFSAVSLGLLYHEPEIMAIPATWQNKKAGSERWNNYARAYQELNRILDHISSSLATEFGGVAEKATIEGWAGKVQHVGDYFAHCISHRAFAEAAGQGWRGRHGLIVTPEAGPALRFATVFVPYSLRTPSLDRRGEYRARSQARELAGCGDCRACLDVCPILRKTGPAESAGRRTSPADSAGASTSDYREACRRRIHALGLVADVCGICVRVCWEHICR